MSKPNAQSDRDAGASARASSAARARTVDLTGWEVPIPLDHIGPTAVRLIRTVTVFGVTIPVGYEFDGASVPRAFYNVLARFTDSLPAAMVHDYRYDPTPGADGLKRRELTRAEADREFYNNLRSAGVGWRRAQLAYRAVRLFGWRPWNAGTKKGVVNV